MQANSVALPVKNGKVDDRLVTKMQTVVKHMKDNNVLSVKEIKPIEVEVRDPNSFVAANTLNAYVHSPWMNPEPLRLKLAWANFEHFIATIWAVKNKAGQT